MASSIMVASSSDCPPDRKTTPGTAAGTVLCRARTVSVAASTGSAWDPLTPAGQPSVEARAVPGSCSVSAANCRRGFADFCPWQHCCSAGQAILRLALGLHVDCSCLQGGPGFELLGSRAAHMGPFSRKGTRCDGANSNGALVWRRWVADSRTTRADQLSKGQVVALREH